MLNVPRLTRLPVRFNAPPLTVVDVVTLKLLLIVVVPPLNTAVAALTVFDIADVPPVTCNAPPLITPFSTCVPDKFSPAPVAVNAPLLVPPPSSASVPVCTTTVPLL